MTRRAAATGFTLLETILVLALIGMLAGAIFGFLRDITGRRDALARATADGQAGSTVIERIEADLTAGIAGGGGALGAGVKGDDHSLRLLTRGVDLPAGGTTHGDLQASEYSFADGVLKARRWNIGTAGAAPPAFEMVCDHIEALRFRYYDGSEWRTSFDSLSADSLPVAVEVAVWFGTPKPPEDPTLQPAPEPRAESSIAQDGEAATGASAPPATEPRREVPSRRPDRLRMIVVPDGPVAAWKELR